MNSDSPKSLQAMQKFAETYAQRTNTFFCSALIAYMYVQMDLLESSLPWSIISPRHFSAKENEQLSFINCSLEEDEQIILT